jgi:hypothetical protein
MHVAMTLIFEAYALNQHSTLQGRQREKQPIRSRPSNHLFVALKTEDVEANSGNNLSGLYSFPVLCHMNCLLHN